MVSCQVSLAESFLGKIIRASWVRVPPWIAVCSAVSSQTWSVLVLETVNMGGGPMAEVVTVRLGNAADELDAAKEFLFSADAVTAKHNLPGPRPLKEVRQYLWREVQLCLVQLEAFHFKGYVGTVREEVGHLSIPAASSVEADNREFREGTGQADKKGRAADLLHSRIPAEVELDGKPTLLTKRIQRKEFLL